MSNIRRLVAFRFDRDPVVCRSRVALLRSQNPGVQIHGVYGGGPGRTAVYRALGKRFLGLDSLYSLQHEGSWNWRHGDLALLDWYRAVGRDLNFEVLHLVEWDLVLFEPLDRVYAQVPSEAVGLTCLTPVTELFGSWEWLRGPARTAEWDLLLDHARTSWGDVRDARACLGVGPCLPRAFLEAYATLDVPELCNDELRLPLAATALGFSLVDTSFRRQWWDTAEDLLFNVGAGPIDHSVMTAELSHPRGRRVFHPVRGRVRIHGTAPR